MRLEKYGLDFQRPAIRTQMSTSQPLIKQKPKTPARIIQAHEPDSRADLEPIKQDLQESTLTGYQESDTSVLEIQHGIEQITGLRYPLLYDILKD